MQNVNQSRILLEAQSQPDASYTGCKCQRTNQESCLKHSHYQISVTQDAKVNLESWLKYNHSRQHEEVKGASPTSFDANSQLITTCAQLITFQYNTFTAPHMRIRRWVLSYWSAEGLVGYMGTVPLEGLGTMIDDQCIWLNQIWCILLE